MAPFGRNPWGLKILLHLLALACVPVSYRLGWQLGRRFWFAFIAGLITALIPDLYFYSGFVLSEVPHFFFGLLFCTLLLSALETMTAGWLIAALLVGSFSVLVRSESAHGANDRDRVLINEDHPGLEKPKTRRSAA